MRYPFYWDILSCTRRHYRNCVNSILVQWGKESVSEEDKRKIGWSEYRKKGHDILVKRLTEQFEEPQAIATSMLQTLTHLDISPTDVKPKRVYNITRTVTTAIIERPTTIGRTGRESRKRLHWTAEEDQVIIQAKRDKKLFKEVLAQVPRRDLSDVYARWRVLKRLHPDLQALAQTHIVHTRKKQQADKIDKKRDDHIDSSSEDEPSVNEAE